MGETEKEKGFFDINGNLIISVSRIPESDINFVCNRISLVVNSEGNYDLYSREDFHSDRWAIINSEGKIIKENIEADYISMFSIDGTAILKKRAGNEIRYYLINTNGDLICNENFEMIKPSKNGYSRARKGGIDYLISSKTGRIYESKLFK